MTGRPSRGFDRLAAIYDPLARIVYGRSIVDSQTCFLDCVLPGSRVLILGGGTGWLLRELYKQHPDCEVWYIESSARMLQRAIKKGNESGRIHFIHGCETDIPDVAFDAVITHFVLDLYTEQDLDRLIRQIMSVSKPSVRWLVADFVNDGRWWQQVMLNLMYKFFQMTCRIRVNVLPNWREAFLRSGLTLVADEKYCNGFIASKLYSYID